MRCFDDKGSALVLVVFTMLIVFFLGFALLEVSNIDFAMANNQVDGMKAFYIAEAGMNKAVAALRYDQTIQNTVLGLSKNDLPYTLPLGENFGATEGHEGNFKILVTGINTQLENSKIILALSSTGKYDKAKRVVISQLQLNISSGGSSFLSSGVAVISDDGVTTKSEAEITGDVYAKGNILIESYNILTGSAYGYGATTEVKSQGHITGDLMSSGQVILRSPVTIDGDLLGGTKLSIDKGSHIGGEVQSQNIDSQGSECTIDGNLYGVQNVKTGSGWVIHKSLYSSGTVTAGSGSTIDGNLYGKEDISLESRAVVKGRIQGEEMVSLKNLAGTEGSIFGRSGISFISSEVTVLGDLISYGNIDLSFYKSTVKGNVFGLGNNKNLNIGSSGIINGIAVSHGEIHTNYSATFGNDVYGRTVSLGGGNNVSGTVHYVQPPCTFPGAVQVDESDFPQSPTFPDFPEPDTLFNILTAPPFLEISEVTPEDLKTGSIEIKQQNINLTDLSSGVYYVDDSFSNKTVNVFGTYNGVITIVSKGKINISGNITTEDHQANGLMLLSFNEITISYDNSSGDVLLFCVPYKGSTGSVTTKSSCELRGGVIAGNFNLGYNSELICDDSITQKFGIGGSAGISSVDVKSRTEGYEYE
ncbi:MAG: hypothetical protein AAGU27_21815 [Dehalobacterium sp.]